MSSLILLKSMLFAEALKKSKKVKKKKIDKPYNSCLPLPIQKKVGSPPSKSEWEESSEALRHNQGHNHSQEAKSPCIIKFNIDKCRTCNKEEPDIPIFDNKYYPNISEEIRNFSGVIVNETDRFSKHICQSCMSLLNSCILFRDLCQKNDERLIKLTIKKEYDNEEARITESNFEYSSGDDSYTFPVKYKKANKSHSKDFSKKPKKCKKVNQNGSEDDSYGIPTPTLSEDDTEIWDCTSCRKEFHDLESYNSHLAECTHDTVPEEPIKKVFLCDTCGRTAATKASLSSHMLTHENVFPFKCEVCPYQGRTIDLLKVHKRSHMIEKPFKCPQCPKTTTTSSNLDKHVRHVHSLNRPFKCPYCERAFPYRHIMKKHVNEIHLRQGSAQCDICNKKFSNRKILCGHRLKIHKIRGYRKGRTPSYLQCQTEQNIESTFKDTED